MDIIVLNRKKEITGFSPFFLMFGREPRIDVDSVFDIESSKISQNTTIYVDAEITEVIRTSHGVCEEISVKTEERLWGYDEKVRGAVLRQGDRGLVKIFSYEGKHKLSDRMESDAYIILDQPNTTYLFLWFGRRMVKEEREPYTETGFFQLVQLLWINIFQKKDLHLNQN